MADLKDFDIDKFIKKHGRPPNTVLLNTEDFKEIFKSDKSRDEETQKAFETFNNPSLTVIPSEHIEKGEIILAIF